MAVYCVPRSDDEIFTDVSGSKNIMLVACPSCANIGYHLHRKENGPILRITLKGIQAQGCKKETQRLADILDANGKNVENCCLNYPNAVCVLNEKRRKQIQEKAKGKDTVISMCCESGQMNLVGILPKHKVIGGMNAKGILRGTMQKGFGKFFIDHDSVEVIDLKLNQ
jgi:hypothetical protein